MKKNDPKPDKAEHPIRALHLKGYHHFKEIIQQLHDKGSHDGDDSPRSRILSAAFEKFAEKGFEATGIREIAEAAKVNQAMIHYYYGSKDNLYHQVIAEQIGKFASAAFSELRESELLEEVVFGIPIRINGMLRKNPLWARLIFREVAEGGAHLEQAIEQLGELGPLGFAKHLSEAYAELVKAGKVADLPPKLVAPLLIGLSFSSVFIEPYFRILTKQVPDESKTQEIRMKMVNEVLRHGLSTQPKKVKK